MAFWAFDLFESLDIIVLGAVGNAENLGGKLRIVARPVTGSTGIMRFHFDLRLEGISYREVHPWVPCYVIANIGRGLIDFRKDVVSMKIRIMPFILLASFLADPSMILAQAGLGYDAQMKANWEKGIQEIKDSPQQIAPSFKEQEHTKLNVKVADKAFGCILALVNVSASVAKGVWRILVAPLPVIQKIQP